MPKSRLNSVSGINSDPRLTEAVIPPLTLAGLIDKARSLGLPPERWFQGLGLTVSQVYEAGTLVSYRQASTIIRRALLALPPGPLGLEVGSRNTLNSFGILGFALMSCRTPRDALDTGLRLHQTAGSLVDLEASIDGRRATIVLHERFPDPSLLPFLSEEFMSSTVAVARAMLGPEVSPLSVELSYPAPDYSGVYKRLFRCPVYFDAAENRLTWDTAPLDNPLPSHNQANLQIALDACKRMLETDIKQGEVVASVERHLRAQLRQRPGIADIAKTLNVTERTLRRQLAANGECFSGIRDRVLEQRARNLLVDSTMTVAQIAHALGYTDSREFRRAFKRWTGHTPTALRPPPDFPHNLEE